MNVYVIYKFANFDLVKEKIEQIKKEVPGITFFYFREDKKRLFLHRYAKKKLRKSNMVIFFDFLDDKSVGSLKHIKWELRWAEKYKKRIVIFKKNHNYSPEIYEKDYSDNEINRYRYKTKSIEDAVAFFKAESEWRVENSLLQETYRNKESSNLSIEDKQLLLDQYRIMIDTSEKLMERRQAVGNLYTTICTALLAFIGASFGFGSLMVSAIASFLSGVVIIVLCLNWRASLNAHELNNTGKFAVINEIEKHLPADMFECEYRYNTLNGIRSYSAREKMLPTIFTFFGIVLILLSVVLIAVQAI